MIESRLLRELYEAAQAAAHSNGILACAEGEVSELADALDQIIEECDGRQAGLIDWAIDNGYPDFETVLLYAR